jgi:ATP-dependent DNA helicase RecG
MDKRLLIGESKYVEYKKTYTKTLLKTVSAYANYHDGWILIGLDDQGNIIGLDDAEEMRLNVENAINDALEPIPYYEMETEWIDGKSIVLLKVYKGEHTPYSVNNRTYRRADTSSIQVDRMSHQELILLGEIRPLRQ